MTVNSNYFEASNLNGTVVLQNKKDNRHGQRYKF